MTYTFPLLTIVWGGIFPSGLILYWIVYTAYLVIQQYLIMGWGNLFPLFGWSPVVGVIAGDRRSPPRRDPKRGRQPPPGPTASPQAPNPSAPADGRQRR